MPWVRIVCAMGENCVCQSIYLELVSRWHTQHTQILAHTNLLPRISTVPLDCTQVHHGMQRTFSLMWGLGERIHHPTDVGKGSLGCSSIYDVCCHGIPVMPG